MRCEWIGILLYFGIGSFHPQDADLFLMVFYAVLLLAAAIYTFSPRIHAVFSALYSTRGNGSKCLGTGSDAGSRRARRVSRAAAHRRRSDIVAQFLAEAVVLTGAGGLLGMMLGWLLSVGVGPFFGIWSAAKAARLGPVEALRHE